MDGNPLRSLKSTLEKAQRNTQNMLTKINRFDERLAAIDEEMQPIQVTTAMYTKAKENIGRTLEEVENTYEYFRVAQQVSGTISSGINLQNDTKQKEFKAAFIRLSEAKRFFEEHRKDIKSSGSALEQIEELLKVASASCIEEFNKLLLSCGKSVVLDGDQYVVSARSVRCYCI
jgi:DNA repair exonuclease SbcCD ATPase subunit